LVESPVKRVFVSTIQAGLSCAPLFHDAICLDVFIPGIFRVPIEVIVIDGELTTDVIHDVWGSRPAFAVRTDSRVMDFRRRPGPDEPDAQVIEDGPDHRRIYDAADDPHGEPVSPPPCRLDIIFALEMVLDIIITINFL
jgi:hypothetical protein